MLLLRKTNIEEEELVDLVLSCARRHHAGCNQLSKLLTESFPSAETVKLGSVETLVRALVGASRTRTEWAQSAPDQDEESTAIFLKNMDEVQAAGRENKDLVCVPKDFLTKLLSRLDELSASLEEQRREFFLIWKHASKRIFDLLPTN